MSPQEQELLEMCRRTGFDTGAAEKLIREQDLNRELRFGAGSETTFLSAAIENANIEMVRLLLQHGADPNFMLCGDENPFWDLQYNDFGETAEENEIGLQMAQLMLEHGADPCMVPGPDEEDLFSWVCYSVFNDEMDGLWVYRSRFFILLVAYGGSSACCKPQLIREFDKSDMAQYRLALVPCGDGYHLTGEIIDRSGCTVALL